MSSDDCVLSGEALFQICVRCDAYTFDTLISTPLWFDIRRFAGDNYFWFLRVQAQRREQLHWRPEISWEQVETVMLYLEEAPCPSPSEFIARFCLETRKPISKDSLLIQLCCARGASTLVRELLRSERIFPVTWSHLFDLACVGQHIGTVEALLESQKPNAQSLRDCLQHACAHGYIEIVELLVRDSRCDLTEMERQLVGLAERKGSEELRRLLKERGLVVWEADPGAFLITLLLLWLLLAAVSS